LDARWWSRLLL